MVGFLMAQVLTEQALAKHAAQLTSALEAERPAHEARLDALREERRRLTARVAKLLHAVEDGADGDSLAGRLREREAEQRRLEIEIAALETRLGGPGGWASWDVTHLPAQLREALENGPKLEARRLVAAIIEEVVVEHQVLRVRYRYPFA